MNKIIHKFNKMIKIALLKHGWWSLFNVLEIK
jgi:hypothetical protein